MDAIAFSPSFRLPSTSAIREESFGIRLISPKEIADGPSQYASQKKFSGLTVSSIQSDGNGRRRPPHKVTPTGRERETYENKAYQSSDVKPSNSSDNQEEIISLFRRIQTSISKSDSTDRPKRRSSSSSQDSASAESVLEVLRKSRRQGKGEKSQESRSKAPNRRKSPPQKELEYASVPGFKLTRPPSNFVKRSPIPHPTIKKDDIVEKKIDDDASVESSNLKDMKIVELKEIAKSRGLKGYSKLKKSELVELLSSENTKQLLFFLF